MPITFLGTVNGENNARPEGTSVPITFDQIRNASNRTVFTKPLTFLEKLNNSITESRIPNKPNENIQTSTSINNDIIKPKYLQDKSIVYKSSGYIRDLLGEGN